MNILEPSHAWSHWVIKWCFLYIPDVENMALRGTFHFRGHLCFWPSLNCSAAKRSTTTHHKMRLLMQTDIYIFFYIKAIDKAYNQCVIIVKMPSYNGWVEEEYQIAGEIQYCSILVEGGRWGVGRESVPGLLFWCVWLLCVYLTLLWKGSIVWLHWYDSHVLCIIQKNILWCSSGILSKVLLAGCQSGCILIINEALDFLLSAAESWSRFPSETHRETEWTEFKHHCFMIRGFNKVCCASSLCVCKPVASVKHWTHRTILLLYLCMLCFQVSVNVYCVFIHSSSNIRL